MSKLRLSLACWNYDRTRALLEGRVQPEGIDLNYLNIPVEETFFRMLRHKEFDVAEMSLSSYVLSLFQPTGPSSRSRCFRRDSSGTPAFTSMRRAGSRSRRIWSGDGSVLLSTR